MREHINKPVNELDQTHLQELLVSMPGHGGECEEDLERAIKDEHVKQAESVSRYFGKGSATRMPTGMTDIASYPRSQDETND